MYTDQSLQYLMLKYPNLESLQINVGVGSCLNGDLDDGVPFHHIYKHCTKLVDLNVWYFERLNHYIPNSSTDFIQNATITNLTLNGCGLSRNFLKELSTRLPSLKNLIIKDCGTIGDKGLEFVVNMEHTKFESLTVSLWLNFGYLGNVHIQQFGYGVTDQYYTTAPDLNNPKLPETTILYYTSQVNRSTKRLLMVLNMLYGYSFDVTPSKILNYLFTMTISKGKMMSSRTLYYVYLLNKAIVFIIIIVPVNPIPM
jgi:hypothetical protein